MLFIIIILLFIFVPFLGITLGFGIGSILLLSIPILLGLCGVAFLILWPMNKYFDNPENERKYQLWVDSLFENGDEKRRRKKGTITTEQSNAIIQYFDRHRSFKNCPSYLSLSQLQKQTILKHMHSYDSGSVTVVRKDSKLVYAPR